MAQPIRLAKAPPNAAPNRSIATILPHSTALLLRQTPEGLASAVADAAVLGGGAEHVNTDLVALQNVSAADVRRVMRRYVVGAYKLTLQYVQEGAAK